MISGALLNNLLSWTEQVLIIAAMGALLPIAFRIRHPRTQLLYNHLLLVVCLLLPLLQPWRHPLLVVQDAGPADVNPAATLAAPVTAPQIREAGKSGAPVSGIATTARKIQPPVSITWRSGRILLWILVAGAVGKLGWLLSGLWQIRRYRIAATPLYPIPESVQAAAALTNADAIFCISPEIPGPVMFGLLNPVVLLPEVFLKLNDEAQCSVACHELLHVKRNDWLMTIFEELAGIVFWFNPAIWWLQAQIRLAREQFVDAEVVCLTASREPYIDALLTIAKSRPTLDLAPAPLFLRRRHLTQRMHLLLKEISISRLRLLSSYISITAVLTVVGWFALITFPLVGEPQVRSVTARNAAPATNSLAPPSVDGTAKPSSSLAFAPIPADPHELIINGVHVSATPDERTEILMLLERAKQNSDMHMPGTSPFSLAVSFTSSGDVTYTGAGEITETWLSGQSWRWTAELGSYSQVRIGSNQQIFDEKQASQMPMRVKMLRVAIFWPIYGNFSTAPLRTATAQWNGKPVTCILLSNERMAAAARGRLWQDREYCIDNASGLLQISSEAPGTYTVYGYSRNLQFHRRLIPDQITIYVNGAIVLDAQVAIADAGAVDANLLTPTPEMMANGRLLTQALPMIFAINVQGSSTSGMIESAMVHATIDSNGSVTEEELSSASDPALAQPALNIIKQRNFSPSPGTQREAYIQVRFLPTS